MIQLRDYQIEAIEEIEKYFKTSKTQYIELPTGAGKTITFLSYAKKNNKCILIIVPSIELLKQVYNTSLLFYNKNEVTRKGGDFSEFPGTVHICVINSARERYIDMLCNHVFDLMIIDEAHHVQADSYRRLVDTFYSHSNTKNTKYLGVTATPDRCDGKLIKEILGKCSFQVSIGQLIDRKHLCDVEGLSVKTKIDLSDIDSHNNDFSLNQLYKKLSCDSRNNLIVDIYKKELRDRKTLIFCINIAHSLEISKLLQSHGIAADHIDGKKNTEQRSAILSSFRNGEISVLCNCQLLTEGFDEPSIDGIILARPTKSRSLFTQMIGRGLRTANGKKNCKIVDIVDNHKSLRGFNSLVTDIGLPEMEEFDSFKKIRTHVSNETLKVMEYSIEKVDLFQRDLSLDDEATDDLVRDLQLNNIYFQHPISIDEASFLLWLNNLKKEIKNGNNS